MVKIIYDCARITSVNDDSSSFPQCNADTTWLKHVTTHFTGVCAVAAVKNGVAVVLNSR
jgi:hypothetical protein